MGKKKDKSKKGHGAEKTASKTEKKITKKTKKELVAHGEEDIETIIAQIAEKDKKQNEVVIEKCPPPSPRSSCSFSLHPERDELVIFGGEYFNGSKTFLYNDLYSYSVKKNEWSVIKAPNSPPPRCAHQAVTLKSGGGQLWVFGGEFASPTQSQFYHYRDLWVYHFRDQRWEKVNATGGPSARSGHRMVAFRKLLVVFGGFHDNLRDCKYFNDVHVFDTETYRWVAAEVQGVPPAPRSACQLCVTSEPSRIIMFGGYSKERIKKDVDKGHTHTDAYALCPIEGDVSARGAGDATAVLKWKWQPVKQCGDCPAARTGFACATLPGNRLLLFGGVRDEDDNEEDVQSLFFNDLHILDLSNMRWHAITLRRDRGAAPSEKKLRRRLKDDGSSADQVESADAAADEVMEEESVAADTAASAVATTFDDGVFKVTIGPQSSGAATGADAAAAGACEPMDQDVFAPRPRMNAVAVVRSSSLYMYGGMFEDGDKQVTLDDLYTLDTQRFNEWTTLYPGTFQSQKWEGSESESSASDDDEDGEDEEDPESDGESEAEPPDVEAGESEQAYLSRTKEFWLERASSSSAMSGEDEELPAGKLRQLALDMARLHFSGGRRIK